MSTPEFPTEPPAPVSPESFPLADWGTRALGFLIDYAPIFILEVVFYRVPFVSFILWLAGLAYWIYIANMEGVTGQSPGKAIMGIRLVNGSGAVLGGGTGIGRKFAHILDSLICFLGWLLPLVDSKKQTIADKVVSSYVVTGAEKKSFAFDLWLPNKAA